MVTKYKPKNCSNFLLNRAKSSFKRAAYLLTLPEEERHKKTFKRVNKGSSKPPPSNSSPNPLNKGVVILETRGSSTLVKTPPTDKILKVALEEPKKLCNVTHVAQRTLTERSIFIEILKNLKDLKSQFDTINLKLEALEASQESLLNLIHA